MDIQFEYSLEKFGELLIILAAKVKNLDKIKAAKLIYLIDRLHLVRYGRIITGDTYFALRNGPIPSRSLDIIDDLIALGSEGYGEEDFPWLRENINVDRKRIHPALTAEREVELDYLSKIEIESINEIISRYGEMDFGELINITHDHIAYKEAWEIAKSVGAGREEIDFKLFFEDSEESEDGVYEYMVEIQEENRLLSV